MYTEVDQKDVSDGGDKDDHEEDPPSLPGLGKPLHLVWTDGMTRTLPQVGKKGEDIGQALQESGALPSGQGSVRNRFFVRHSFD